VLEVRLKELDFSGPYGQVPKRAISANLPGNHYLDRRKFSASSFVLEPEACETEMCRLLRKSLQLSILCAVSIIGFAQSRLCRSAEPFYGLRIVLRVTRMRMGKAWP
jgi:hypothetical protein